MSDTKWISAGFGKYNETSAVEEDEDTMTLCFETLGPNTWWCSVTSQKNESPARPLQ
jgi:hypothetical protein